MSTPVSLVVVDLHPDRESVCGEFFVARREEVLNSNPIDATPLRPGSVDGIVR
jgi:hypothetical protein